jgi:toxin ParE1/3/4
MTSRVEISWAEQAATQLQQAFDYIALSSREETAVRIVEQILASVQQLAAFPLSGRTGRTPGTRELVVSQTPFVVAYAVEKGSVVILAIYHGAQKWPDTL